MSQTEAPRSTRGPGRPRRSPEAVAEQRAHLLEAAMATIRRAGPDASVEDMAGEAGVSKPVLYAAFGDKNGIADAVAVELVERAERDIAPTLFSGGAVSMEEALRLAVEAFFEIVTADPAIYGFVFRSIRASDRGLLDNALVRSLQARFRALASVLAPGADPHVVEVMGGGTFGFVIGAIESWLTTRATERDDLIDLITLALARGLDGVAAQRSAAN